MDQKARISLQNRTTQSIGIKRVNNSLERQVSNVVHQFINQWKPNSYSLRIAFNRNHKELDLIRNPITTALPDRMRRLRNQRNPKIQEVVSNNRNKTFNKNN